MSSIFIGGHTLVDDIRDARESDFPVNVAYMWDRDWSVRKCETRLELVKDLERYSRVDHLIEFHYYRSKPKSA